MRQTLSHRFPRNEFQCLSVCIQNTPSTQSLGDLRLLHKVIHNMRITPFYNCIILHIAHTHTHALANVHTKSVSCSNFQTAAPEPPLCSVASEEAAVCPAHTLHIQRGCKMRRRKDGRKGIHAAQTVQTRHPDSFRTLPHTNQHCGKMNAQYGASSAMRVMCRFPKS